LKTVRELLDGKVGSIYSIAPGALVYEALELMATKEIGALLVIEEGRLAGIMSERDYARKVILHGKSSQEIAVRDIMTTRLVTVRPSQSVDECMGLMTDHRIRHLPVMEGGRLIGVVSIGDLVKAVIEDQRETIKQLENYIHS